MTAPQPGTKHPVAHWISSRLTAGPAVGYIVFAAGALLGILLSRNPLSYESNPALLLLLVWVISGITHIFVKEYSRACRISAFGSALGYIILVAVFFPTPFNDKWFIVGIVLVGVFGYILSSLMGIPVAKYRRSRNTPSQQSVRKKSN